MTAHDAHNAVLSHQTDVGANILFGYLGKQFLEYLRYRLTVTGTDGFERRPLPGEKSGGRSEKSGGRT